MTCLVIPVQLTAAVTIAVLVTICLVSTAKSQDQDSGHPDKPLVEIVEQLEKAGYGPFHEISKDDGNWEVEVNREGVAYELTIDPKTGQVRAEHRDDPERLPSRKSMPLSKLLKMLSHDKGFRIIDDISFEHRYWEIEVFQENQNHEIHVDPLTAKVVSDRIDD